MSSGRDLLVEKSYFCFGTESFLDTAHDSDQLIRLQYGFPPRHPAVWIGNPICGGWSRRALPGTAPRSKVAIIRGRHSCMLSADILKSGRDARSPLLACREVLRGHDRRLSDTRLHGAVVRKKRGIRLERTISASSARPAPSRRPS